MKPSIIALLPLLAVAAACGGSGSTDTSSTTGHAEENTAMSLPDDAVILTMAYDTDYHVSDGFFVDERAQTAAGSYTVHHVLDESGSYELCTDDLVEAQAWEHADNESRSVSGYYVTSYENERYFEFVRELAYDQDVGNVGEPTTPGYARVFKCAHTNRNGVDRSLTDGYSGTMNSATMNDSQLRDFTEYLWQFRFFNVSRRLVLDSYSNSALSHTLLLALVVYRGSGSCDRIDVVEWRFNGDSASGRIAREFRTIRSIAATTANGTPEVCD